MKRVTIVGGGLAGLTLGIGLRQREIPVTLYEAGTYPRHRVCGEFISGRGQDTLTRLGLHELFDRAGAVPAKTAAFFSETRSTPARPLPSRALCLSRHELDAALAKKFSELAGDLRLQRWQEKFTEGIIRANGRRLEIGKDGPRWFGLKIHARNVSLTADLEMHLSPRGYVGLCRINDNAVNVCGLFLRVGVQPSGCSPNTQKGESPNWREHLCGLPGSPLHQRLASANFDEESFCAIAGLSLRPQQASDRDECSIGDAITMIPPVTGNGMSMAFESAELAINPLTAWSRDELSWPETREQIARACDTAFARRLRWAKWLQHAMLSPALRNPLLMLARRSDRFWRTAFEHTR